MNKRTLRRKAKKQRKTAVVPAQEFKMPTHIYAEAFKLMTYRCERCGEFETIWNSRNGVTFFSVRSACCVDALSSHVNWHDDVFAPAHQPNPGDRIFVGEPEQPRLVVFG